MNTYAVICTRTKEDISPVTHKLLKYFSNLEISSFVMCKQESIFRAYDLAFKKIDPEPDDLVIFCHDDIEISDAPEDFINKLIEETESDDVGFVGVAGTSILEKDGVWWNKDNWRAGKHRGRAYHIHPNKKTPGTQKTGRDGRKEKMCVRALASMQFPRAAHLTRSEAKRGR